jgi:zinc transport system substrate-binding protein
MKRILLWLLAALPLVGLRSAASFDPVPLRIITSIFPLAEFTKEIAAGRGVVSLLLPPGAGIHTWQPRASDIVRLSSADLFIQVGAGLEPWINSLLKSISSANLKVLAVADSLPIEEHRHEEDGEMEADPHVWLDFGLDMKIADLIASKLTEIDPPGAAAYQAGASRLKGRLQELDAAYSKGLSHCASKDLVIGGHAAFGYLAKRYGLKALSLSGLSPDAEARPSRLIAAVAWGKQHDVRAVFMEANASSQMSEMLAQELHAEILVLHAAANLNKKEWESGLSFFDIMEQNLVNLKKGLACE